MEQRPAAMLALDAAKIGADLALQFRIVRLAEILAQQDVLGRDRRVRLEFEDPVPVGPLLAHQRLRGTADIGLDRHQLVDCVVHRARAAAVSPDRSAPSIVAGSPVAVQSPARNRFAQRVRQGGRRASCAGVAAKVARFSLTMRQGGGRPPRRWTAATSRHSKAAKSCVSISTRRSAALTVTDSRSANAKTHSAVPPTSPTSRGAPAGGAILKCALTMAQKASGTMRSGSSS